VLVAESADEGLPLIRSARPDVIVSDIGMPVRDGYQLIRDVRNLSTADGGRTPAIALTAFARSEDRTRAMLAGYQVHVSKPIEPQELIATIRSLVYNSSERDRDRPDAPPRE
jgi:CheY-like chemotaxis protein